MKTCKYFLGIFFVLALQAASLQALSFDSESDEPVFFRADKITYDKVLNRVIAEGNVEITKKDDFISANRLIYSYETEHIVADGDVFVRRPGEKQYSASYVDLTRDLSDGFVRQIRIRLEEETRIAAYEAYLCDKHKKVFTYGVYSPCKICRETPWKPPLWQIKARRFIHDEKEGTITYHHAYFEFWGVPLLYTPYFRHPDAKQERSSGFLKPDFKTSTDTGTTFWIPYYFALGRDKELTLTPILSTSERYLLRKQYKQVFKYGEVSLDSSGGYINDDKIQLVPKLNPDDMKNKWGGHLFWKTDWHLTDVWRLKGELECVGQKTYLKRYNISDKDVLKSIAQIEGFWERDYLTQSAYGYQGLRTVDNHSVMPRLLPEFGYYMDRDLWCGSLRNTVYFRHFSRNEGLVHRLASVDGEWSRTEILPLGAKVTLRPGYRADFFDIELSRMPDNKALYTGRKTRAYGDVAVIASYPFLAASESSSFVIEPKIGYLGSPVGLNSDDIPNEDSQNFEFTETKFFTPNLFSGRSRISGGSRIDYGLWFDGAVNQRNLISGMVGQIYQFREDNDFPKGSGLDKRFSDVVGRLTFDPTSFYTLAYRFRADPDSQILKRSETNVTFGPTWLKFGVDHILLRDSDYEKTFHQQQQLKERVTLNLYDYWKANASALHDIGQTTERRKGRKSQNLLNFSWGISYEDECFLANIQMTRHFTPNQNLPPRNEFLFTIGLKAFAQTMQQSFGTQTYNQLFEEKTTTP